MTDLDISFDSEDGETLTLKLHLHDPASGNDATDVWSVSFDEQLEYFEAASDLEALDVIQLAIETIRDDGISLS